MYGIMSLLHALVLTHLKNTQIKFNDMHFLGKSLVATQEKVTTWIFYGKLHVRLLIQLWLITLLLFFNSLLNLYQMVGTWLSMSVIGCHVVLFLVFLCSGFRSPLSPLFCFITVFVIICVSQMKYRTPMQTEHMFIMWRCIGIKAEVSRE